MNELINNLERLVDLAGEKNSKDRLDCILKNANTVDEINEKIKDEFGNVIDTVVNNMLR